MEFTCLIVKEYFIEELDLNYFIGVNRVHIDIKQVSDHNAIFKEEEALKFLLNLIKGIQDDASGSVIQLIKEKYVLNLDHIYLANYYVQKAFAQKTNISKKKNIELLLYLSTHRQISKGFESFGIDYSDLERGELLICIISPINNLEKISMKILKEFNAVEIELGINKMTIEKIKRIKKFYKFSESQIKSVQNSYGIQKNNLQALVENLDDLSSFLFDLICEKMALLNLEKKSQG
ncbi:hypothetical protein LCGC14_0601520 [marine sediment metagenome]|uniref:Uncharacterized protein n=1 Tax=marine sediment metagenome TaxID=412755 RepID=A0A0F9UIV4_9ZZZZ